jgi:hypothetical protein
VNSPGGEKVSILIKELCSRYSTNNSATDTDFAADTARPSSFCIVGSILVVIFLFVLVFT